MGFFFVDAEKAFDNLNWDFMFELMHKMDMGNRFIGAIKAVYSQQNSKLVINADLTDGFKIEKGVRQGCPLSPLLFVMVLEVLLREIQKDKEIKGINYKGFSYKYKAFADDVMFVIEEPMDNITKLLEKIQRFGKVAGFYINRQKSKIMCKNMTNAQKLKLSEISQCEVVQKVRYLGIEMMMKNIDLYKNNYEKIWKQKKI